MAVNQSTNPPLTVCHSCKDAKPSSDFYSDKSKARGHGTECKLCVNARGKARYQADREAWIKRSAAAKKANPERYREHNREYAQRNRLRTADREREYQRLNRDRYTQHKRAWYQRNIERAREQGRINASARRSTINGNGAFRVTERDLRRALQRAGGKCSYCYAAVDGVLHWDHVMPVARGGSHSIGNLVPACAPCNHSKSRATVTEWRKRKGR